MLNCWVLTDKHVLHSPRLLLQFHSVLEIGSSVGYKGYMRYNQCNLDIHNCYHTYCLLLLSIFIITYRNTP
nr:MAG TPA: putative AdoMet-dependent methyltransferase [Caudoviricetes sp.]